MPGTPEELVNLAVSEVADLFLDDHVWADGTRPDAQEHRDLMALRVYHLRQWLNRQRDKAPQRKAMRLLRSFLTPEQRRQLRLASEFRVTTAAGTVYRLMPRMGTTQQVTRHGSRWFVARRFCLHDDRAVPEDTMPPADLTLTHMLMLVSDEGEFLRLANATDGRDQLWNRAYLRRIREGRQYREATP